MALRYLLLAAGLAGCMAGSPEGEADRPGRVLLTPAPDDDGVTRVLVYHDMEGLAGQDDWRTFLFPWTEFYEEGRKWLTADMNAVIDGLYAGGADEVHVVDAHGSTNPNPDLLLDELDSRATMVFKDEPFQPYMDLTEAGVYDAIAVVAMHAKTGSVGFASHTFTIGMEVILNGMSITETETIGYSWGRVGVPVIFASGDDKLGKDLETMPWIEYVTTKEATSASTAVLRPVDEVRRELQQAAKRAMENLDEAKAMRVTEPVTTTLRVVPPSTLTMLRGVPGLDYTDNQVTFEAADYAAAIEGAQALMNVAGAGWNDLMFELVAAQSNGDAMQKQWLEAVVVRWFDYESGRWTPPPRPEPEPGRKYHGST